LIHNTNLHNIPDRYDRSPEMPVLNQLTRVTLADFISKARLPYQPTIVDMCCGTGAVSVIISEIIPNHHSIVGVDIDYSMLEIANSKGKAHINILADALNTPFLDNTFDILICRMGVHYLGDKWVKEFSRIVKEGGHILISELCAPCTDSQQWINALICDLLDNSGIKILTKENLEEILPNGFSTKHLVDIDPLEILCRKIHELTDDSKADIFRRFQEAPECLNFTSTSTSIQLEFVTRISQNKRAETS